MDAAAAPLKPRKKRPPPKSARVEKIERVTPGLMRITFGGPELLTFGPPKPAGHIKLYFPPDGMVWPSADPDAPRPPSRTYTPRRHDAARGLVEVEFVLHGEGLASNWAENARVGDLMTIGGPGGGYAPPADADSFVIVADDSAMPAAGMVLESLPPGASVRVICEVTDKLEEHPLSPTVACDTQWLHRNPTNAAPCTLLEKAVRELGQQPAGACWWIACESGAMRRIRDMIFAYPQIDRSRVHTRGYWKFGSSNHPDHDYGLD